MRTTRSVSSKSVNRVADEVMKEANKRGVTVLMTERMSESVAVLVGLSEASVFIWDACKNRHRSRRVGYSDSGGYFWVSPIP